MRRRRLLLLGLLGALLLLSRFFSWEYGTPIDPAGAPVWVADHGYHAGLIFKRASLERHGGKMAEVWLRDFRQADWFEIGWGDMGFYSEVPTWEDLRPGIVARALFWPTESIMHIATGSGDLTVTFANSDLIRLPLGAAAMARLLASIEESAASEESIGEGLYLISRFYAGHGSYHLFNTCNSWVAQRLRAAGLAAAPAPALLSGGLMWDLRLRYGDVYGVK